MAAFANRYRWPEAKPEVPPITERNPLSQGIQEILSRCISRATGIVVDLGSGLGSSTRFVSDLAPQANIIAIDYWDGRPEARTDSAPAEALSRPFETFLSECWGYRTQVVALKAEWAEGLRRITQGGLLPDLINFSAKRGGARIHDELVSAIKLFPGVEVVGDGWDDARVRAAVETVAHDWRIQLETNGAGWRLHR